MSKEYGFPIELLEKPVQERVMFFKKYTVGHRILREAFNQLIDILSHSGNTSIILVCGPSGVGKTTLYMQTMKRIIEAALPDLERDPGLIPIVGKEAIAPDNGNFDWKDYYIRALEALDEPLVHKKIDFDDKYKSSPPRKDDRNRHLRKALENALKFRRPKAFLIDEAQHLTRMSSGRKLRNQMDTIKSLASLSQVPHVLIGTYELLPFRNLSGQLSRRGTDIHIPRYRAEKSGEMEEFVNILWAFQKFLPLEKEPVLIDYYEYFYERTIGCVGILKDWLMRTYSHVADQNKEFMTVDDFKPFALSLEQCIQMAGEAREGELKLEENQEQQNELKRLLGIQEAMQDEQKPISNGKKRIGQRKPTRDEVGDQKHVQ